MTMSISARELAARFGPRRSAKLDAYYRRNQVTTAPTVANGSAPPVSRPVDDPNPEACDNCSGSGLVGCYDAAEPYEIPCSTCNGTGTIACACGARPATNVHNGIVRCDHCWRAFQDADPDWMFKGKDAVAAGDRMGRWGER